MSTADTVKRTSPVLIAAAWAVVVLPTAWGLRYTVANALKLFTAPSAAAAPRSSHPISSTLNSSCKFGSFRGLIRVRSEEAPSPSRVSDAA
jgi:hypothetical protein